MEGGEAMIKELVQTTEKLGGRIGKP